MIIRFLLPQSASEPKELVSKLQNEHFCPLGQPGGFIGFVRNILEENGRFIILADIDDPELIESINKRYGYNEPIEIDLEQMSMEIPIFHYMHNRFPKHLSTTKE